MPKNNKLQLEYMKMSKISIVRFPKLAIFSSLMFLIICFPLQFQPIKIGFIILIFVTGSLKFNSLKLSKRIIFIFLIIFAYNTFNLFFMPAKSYDPLPYISLYLISPLIYIILFTLNREYFKGSTFYFLICSLSLFISALNINSVTREAGIGSIEILNLLDTGRVGIHANYTQIVNNNVYSLFFLTPFLAVLLIRRAVPLILILPVFALTLVSVILSGRRALWAAVGISLIIFIGISFYKFLRSRISMNLLAKNLITISFIAMVVVLFFNLSFIEKNSIVSGLNDRFFDAFTESGGSGVRDLQQEVLIREWLNSPIFGNGIAVPASIVRSEEFLTAYESSYHALLYKIGIIGFIFYAIPTITVLFGLLFAFLRTQNDTFYVASGVGLLSILIGIYSNPYFETFDGLWMLFLPVIAYNKLLKESRIV